MDKLKNYGVKTVVITDGVNGSYVNDAKDNVYQAGVCNTEKAKERTGAGDAYASGFLYACLNDYPVEKALKYGALNADNVIMQIGSQKGLMTKEEIEKKYKEYDNLKSYQI